ncbi:LysR family transcriptional regulator [Chelatococcus composti]|jgi:DNA-binding transcriptional LysR family regulator|uniref:DNA-binding transcriptional LysR family regulator n=1 Tax=Chelatococcus composti TaxID=1743235 RepID=A0A841K7M1_9HYPH|nr:LysR family transcriptional regulator [Chelatococcus composti]MBB6168070.1 DNA-binding transcriptional LysR family regulator [Chelatococcus composti]MBS7734741.1 LysR family transcriptional regulator [Chelatococcus composti]GGG33808.1 LysR family transcriptional regulator [Chelatococcus composti]
MPGTSTDPFAGLAAFLAVAETGSFTAAAARLGVSPAAVSQTVKALENRLGTPLFLRTTRRVGLTEAGAALLIRARPAAAEILQALETAGEMGEEPAGVLRLTVPRMAVPLVIEPVIPVLRRAHPKVAVEISVEDAAMDLPAHGYDAGIRIGEMVERDMVAVRLTRDIVWSVVASPAYLAARGTPQQPEDLTQHDAIRYRFPTSGAIYRWEFERDGRTLTVDPPGSLVVNDGALLISFALAGLGLAYVADIAAEEEIEADRLRPVLQPFLPRSPGLFLYFPRRASIQPKLRAFIDVMRTVLRAA